MKNVLVLGGTGFIGFNLHKYLSKKGVRVTTASYTACDYMDSIILDIRDKEALLNIVSDYDGIVNLAGISGYVESLKDPQKTIEINTIGHLNILEACHKKNHKARVVLASSRLEYGVPQYLPVNLNHASEPHTLYGISKYTATKYSMLYNQLYGIASVVLRISNPFGPQPFPTHTSYNIINHFIWLSTQGKNLTIFGDGKQKRDYIYIEDVCNAIYKSLTQPEAVGKIFNIGSGKPVSLINMAQSIIDEVGSGKILHQKWPHDWKNLETGDFYYDLNEAKIILEWEPQNTLAQGIQKIKKSF